MSTKLSPTESGTCEAAAIRVVSVLSVPIRAYPCVSVRIRARAIRAIPCYPWGLAGSVGILSQLKTGGVTSILPESLTQPSIRVRTSGFLHTAVL